MEAKLREYRLLAIERRRALENQNKMNNNPEEHAMLLPEENKEAPNGQEIKTGEILTEIRQAKYYPGLMNSDSWLLLLTKWSFFFTMWLGLYIFFLRIEFGAVFIVVSALIFIYFNTRTGPKQEGEMSAYSVFNKDCKSIDGTFTAEQFEKELRYGPNAVL